jgi:uncharacterized delta-60 repeat protein
LSQFAKKIRFVGRKKKTLPEKAEDLRRRFMKKLLFYKQGFGKVFAAFLSVLILSIGIFAQQGALDTSWGMNNTGIYQDPLPSTTDPTNIARRYGPIEILANGKTVVAGSYTKSLGGGNFVNGLVIRRLNADGSADTTFANGAGTIETTFLIFNGTETNMLQPVMAIQPSDGKIVIAAQCNITFAPNPNDNFLGSDLCLMRYNSDGTLDTSFGGNTVAAWAGNGNFPPTTYTMPAGKVWTYTGTNQVLPTVNGNFNGIPVRIRFTTDGRIVVFGNSRDFLAPNQTGRFKGFVAVYSTSGALQSITNLVDTTGNTTDGFGVTKINDGDILSNGDFLSVGSQSRLVSTNPAVFTNAKWCIFRNSAGQFLDQVNNNPAEGAFGLVQIRSNKILMAGVAGANQRQFVRYNGDLTIDTTFGTGGRLIPICNGNFCYDTQAIAGMSMQTDGKIIGTTYNGNIFRINPDGSPDRSFALYNTSVQDMLTSRGILPSGRYTTPFPIRGGTDNRIFFSSFAERPNGRMLITGATGTSGFGNPVAQAVAIQLKTYLRNGGTHSDFNNDGKAELSVYRNGVWYVLDSFDNSFSVVPFGLGTDKLAPADFDGDGKTDRAVFRDGIWYILQSSNNQLRVAQFGSAGDLPRPGDFNGDGFADLAVFRPTTGVWYVLYSNPIQPGNITFAIVPFGQNGDAPLIGDFDGDGKTDYAVFRPTTGVWYWLRSTDGQFRAVPFGQNGDIPVVGDYDADGQVEPAVFRPSNGTWYLLRSTAGFTQIQFGANGDKPTPGDFDNDGRNDLAVYRGGIWYVLQSSNNLVLIAQFGIATDIPVESAYLP